MQSCERKQVSPGARNGLEALKGRLGEWDWDGRHPVRRPLEEAMQCSG